jgi:hypothetical protein
LNIIINKYGLKNIYIILLAIHILVISILLPLIIYIVNYTKKYMVYRRRIGVINNIYNHRYRYNHRQNVYPVINNRILVNIIPSNIPNNINRNIISQQTIVSETQDNICLVCYDKKRDILFMPCNHLCCCDNCSNNINKCPYCRVDIENKVKIFIP